MFRTIKRLLEGESWKRLALPILLMTFDAIGSIILYFILYLTVISLLDGSLTSSKVILYTVICAVTVVYRLLVYRTGYLLCFTRGADVCHQMRLGLAEHYRSLSLGYFNQNSTGYLLNTLTKDLSSFEEMLTHALPSLVYTVVLGGLILIGTFFINWKLALAECVVLLVAFPILLWGNRMVEKYGSQKRRLTDKMISVVLEYIRGMRVFKSHNMTSTHFTRMLDALETIRGTSVKTEQKMAVPTGLYAIVVNFLLPLVLLVGSYLLMGGQISSDSLVAFLIMSLALSGLLISFEHAYNLLKDLKLAADNLENAFDTKPLPYTDDQFTLQKFDVEFKHVDFSYNNESEVLHDISFSAKEGDTTALIGPSGSGKSTIASLITRFWDTTSGIISVGGRNIKELNPDRMLRYVSAVFQENTLFSGTIANNIKAGRPDATMEEAMAAAKAAHCHEFIEKLPEGYQTEVAEGGDSLSGGEKQRIAIARAILKEAPILLLDEFSAFLDADNETKINQALDRLMEHKTVFVIAHRLNTIKNADQIILLSGGEIEEIGSHDSLMAKRGHYYQMVQEQEGARRWVVKGG